MPITISNNKIWVWYATGDTKGNSFANPYTFADIKAVSDACTWNPPVTSLSSTYNSPYVSGYNVPYGVYVTGASTYFWEQNRSIYFDVSRGITALQTAENCHFRLGNKTSGLYKPMMIHSNPDNSWYTYLELTNAEVELYNISISRLRMTNNSGISSTKKSYYENIQVFDPAIFGVGANLEIINSRFYQAYFTINTIPDKLENIELYNSLFYSNGLGSDGRVYAKNIRFYDSSYLRYYLTGGIGGESVLVDSQAPENVTLQSYYTMSNTSWTMYLKTTFNVNVTDSSGATMKLYDASSNQILSVDMSSNTYTSEVTYWKELCTHTYDGTTPNVLGVKTTYHPFKLTIEKQGYQKLEIPSISVVAGQPTYIRGSLVPTPSPVYVNQYIDGSICASSVLGSISTPSLSGIVTSIH